MLERIPKLLLVGLLSGLLASCGAFMRVAYNNSETALRFMAHDYFDIDGSQTEILQGGLDRFHNWHRHEELPRYAAAFDDAAQRISRGVQPTDVTWAIETVRARSRRLADRGVDDATPALATINGDNIAALDQKFADKNEEFRREFLKANAVDRERAQFEAYTKRLSDWIGDLEPAQERLTQEFVRAHPKASEIKLAERKRRQQELLALLRQPGDRGQLNEQLHDYFNNFERNRPPEYADIVRRFESDFVDYVVALDRSLSATQRERVVQKFNRYAQDFRALAAEGRIKKDPGSVATN